MERRPGLSMIGLTYFASALHVCERCVTARHTASLPGGADLGRENKHAPADHRGVLRTNSLKAICVKREARSCSTGPALSSVDLLAKCFARGTTRESSCPT